MKYIWIVLLSLLCVGCGGQFWLTPIGHRAFYRSADGQFSCYTNNCCYPYKEKAMVCAEASSDSGIFNTITVEVKVIPDK